MDWTQIIVAMLGTGGFVGLFLIAERKTKAQMANMEQAYQLLNDQYTKMQERFDVETDKVGKLHGEIEDLHNKLDAANTRASVSEMKRCDIITCVNRRPPLSDTWRMDVIDEGTDEDNC